MEGEKKKRMRKATYTKTEWKKGNEGARVAPAVQGKGDRSGSKRRRGEM